MNEMQILVNRAVKASLQLDADAGFAMVPSRSAGKAHRVTIVNGKAVACTCRGFHFTGSCWALKSYRSLAASV